MSRRTRAEFVREMIATAEAGAAGEAFYTSKVMGPFPRQAPDVERVPVGPPCEWCGAPIDVSAGDAQARCRCGLP